MSARRLMATAVACASACLCSTAWFAPSGAYAFATPGGEPTAGPPGLPDGRIYEQVSPTNKYGNSAGGPNFNELPFMAIGVNGNEVFYSTNGPVGESSAGLSVWAIAKRTVGGWASNSAIPRAIGEQGVFSGTIPTSIGVSSNMERVVFSADGRFVTAEPDNKVLGQSEPVNGLFLAGAEGRPGWLGEPLWIAQPQVSNRETWSMPPLAENQNVYSNTLAGASTDLKTVYFTWPGTLVQGDNTANPKFEGATRSSKKGFGLYQWREGRLSYAGVLPDGTIDPYGADGAVSYTSSCMNGDGTRNQVSLDGSRAFFISPVPTGEAPPSDPTEVYVHKVASDGSESAILVSRDTLLPSQGRLPAPAPHAPIAVRYPPEAGSFCEKRRGSGRTVSYMYASPDGSRAFFESSDQLTSAAPNDASIKEYELSLEDETLTYLPGVTVGSKVGTSPILASTADGSRFVFEKTAGNPGEALELDMWTDGVAGPSDGQITPIVQLPAVATMEIGPTRMVDGGNVVVFQTIAPIAGFNNGGFNQVYRYDASGNTLACVSCPPTGTTPSGPAYLTHDFASPGHREDTSNLNPNRGVSSDGTRVFFDSPDSLVPQDVNGHRDVYEWNAGTLFLISTGTSHEDSFFGDNTPSGGDVVFSTAQGLLPGDDDESYDVYDARIPRSGDNSPPKALSCQGDVCQGPPSVPVLLGIPASASFNGLGDAAPVKPAITKTKRKHVVHKHRTSHRRHRKRHRQVTGKSAFKTKING